ncbi:Flp pilus assembly protein CpaB [Filobacillus milosensis]|uniref:Flp pilus assembly protein CpaB n=1 Tax=Filobacillus milosensis TaxID=94137 RepID=A0A4Y8IIH2_9BACI|nr:Flp pilus assembly protein CpaB [Filobacillus milosensis]TFB19618.1 Flp pilus assembly protein CpaB [Filobacillus milosensis]
MQSKLLFLLAILMGIITTAIFFYTNQSEAPDPTDEAPMMDVIVLAEDVTENQRLTAEDVQVKSVPEDQVHAQAVQSVDEVSGKFATADMVAGEVVLAHRLKSSKEEQDLVSRKVNEGYRAVSVGVDMVRSVTNLINPEDYVDVVFTYENTEKDNPTLQLDPTILSSDSIQLIDNKESVLLLKKVRVLSVGRKMVSGNNGEETAEYSQVTLELNPEDMITLVNASEEGSIHLALHSRIVDEGENDSEE